MKWILVLISLQYGPDTPMAGKAGEYDTMTECFAVREVIVEKFREIIQDSQAVCVRYGGPKQKRRANEFPR